MLNEKEAMSQPAKATPQSPTPTDEFTKPGEVGFTVTAYMALQAENAELREALKHVTRYADKQVKESQEDAILWAQLASIATEALTRPPEARR